MIRIKPNISIDNIPEIFRVRLRLLVEQVVSLGRFLFLALFLGALFVDNILFTFGGAQLLTLVAFSLALLFVLFSR